MFTKLTLKNFKAWRERIDVELTPVTMLLGTNSSGKSSLLQALLLLKQTAASPDRSIHLNLGGDEVNDYFNFGHFNDVLTQGASLRQNDVPTQGASLGQNDVLTQGASPRQFQIGFEFRRPPGSQPDGKQRVDNGEFTASYGMTSSGAAVIQELILRTGPHKFRAVRRDKGAYSLFVDDESQPRGKSRAYAPERSIALPVEAIQLLAREGPLVEDISLALRRELVSIAYLGPLRRKPERDYVWNKAKPGELGIDGAGVINAILASALLRSRDEGAGQTIHDVSSWLARMGVADRLEVRQLGHSTRYEIVVHKDGVASNLRDVGIGVSQVLPVITLAFFAQPGSTVLLEEPEIHLHPLAQSALAELFVEVSRLRKVQFIVETHSEHLFRRLQTLVAKDEVRVDDCRLYFVERNGADAVLKQLQLDAYGRVLEWPDQFFGDALGETREQARLVFERQKQARPA